MSESMISLTDIRERVQKLDQQILELRTRRAALAELLNEFDPDSDGKRLLGVIFGRGVGKKPKEAILELLRLSPGLTPTQIADRLADVVDSGAKDKRNVLRSTAAKMVGLGELAKDAHNRLTIPDERRQTDSNSATKS